MEPAWRITSAICYPPPADASYIYIYDPVYTGCEGHSKRPWAKGLGVYLMEFRGNDQPHTFFISQHLFLAFLGVSRQEKSLRAFRTPLTGKHAKSNNTEID
jgi:hypothetical protein